MADHQGNCIVLRRRIRGFQQYRSLIKPAFQKVHLGVFDLQEGRFRRRFESYFPPELTLPLPQIFLAYLFLFPLLSCITSSNGHFPSVPAPSLCPSPLPPSGLLRPCVSGPGSRLPREASLWMPPHCTSSCLSCFSRLPALEHSHQQKKCSKVSHKKSALPQATAPPLPASSPQTCLHTLSPPTGFLFPSQFPPGDTPATPMKRLFPRSSKQPSKMFQITK